MAERRPYDSMLWRKLRLQILARDGHRCVDCGGRATCVDHVKPWRQGGAWYDPANLVSVCRSDNAKRAYKTGGRQRVGEPLTDLTWTVAPNVSRRW